jgi:LacI family transcriptional regulator
VKDVLKIANMSRSTLEARFREILGRTVHAEIRRVQLENAKRLLKSSKMPIKEIVHEVGASLVQYFTAMIRQATGQTPGQIRNDAQH